MLACCWLGAALALGALNVTEETRGELLPSATGFAARRTIAVLRARNVPIAASLTCAGIPKGDIDNCQGRISALAQGKLLEYAAEALGDHEFGLHLAEQANPREAGLLFYVASAAEHVGDALALLARYCRTSNEAVRLKLTRSPEGVTAEAKYVGLPRQFAWQNTEFLIAILVKGLREMAGRDFRPLQVAFTLARNSGPREFERFFDCPVEFSASADQFTLSNETLAIPLVTEDHYLLEALRPICDEAAKDRKTVRGTLSSLVENEVQKLLHHGKANRQRVAKALGLSERALSQGLAEESTSFDHVLDRLRHSLALQYVKERRISLDQIAWLLGYEGQTSFNYAYARWTGRSASEARKEQQRPKVELDPPPH
jgi:AraC-like DNA-binding protein